MHCWAAKITLKRPLLSQLDACLAVPIRESNCKRWGLGFRVQGLGFRVQGLGFRVPKPWPKTWPRLVLGW